MKHSFTDFDKQLDDLLLKLKTVASDREKLMQMGICILDQVNKPKEVNKEVIRVIIKNTLKQLSLSKKQTL